MASAVLLGLTPVVTMTHAPAAFAATSHPACAQQVPGSPAGPTGPSATGYVLNIGNLATVYDPAGNPPATTPSTFAYDTGTAANPSKTVSVSDGENADVADAAIETGQVTSTNSGTTFPASSYQHFTGTSPAPAWGTVRLRSGRMLSIDFKPQSATATTATIATFSSDNNGATWSRGTTTFTAPSGKQFDFPLGLRTDEQPIELADGTIVMSYYTHWLGDPTWSAELMQSNDGGTSFTRRGVIAAGTSSSGYNEAGIAQLPNGNLIAVVRTAVVGAFGPTNLVYTTSTNGGVGWSAPASLLVSFDGQPAATKPGINPQLVLMPNGILVLSSGRDNTGNGNNWVAMSTNGSGTGWIGALTYRNCPQIEDSNGSLWHGSSGNTGLTAVDRSTVMQAADNCHVGYCLFAGDSGFTTDNQYRIVRRFADVLTPDVGRIDLAGKLAAGRISVSGMTWTSPAHPRTGVQGAFDGSVEYWSSAVSTGPGSMVISLDKTYSLTKVGLSLRNGRSESAQVSFSTDGSNWSAPAVTATNRTDYAINYQTLATPVNAKFVKVDVTASSTCDAGLGSSCAFLNEIELYSTTDSFENDPLNNRPRGWTGLNSTWVSTSNLDDSAHALLLSDGSTTASATAVLDRASGTSRTLEFKIKPMTVPHANLFTLNGKVASGATVAAYHFGIFGDGTIRRYTGSTWSTIAGATAPLGSWTTIRVVATTTGGTISVNGGTPISISPWNAVSSLTSAQFSSGGTSGTGDNFAIDDVLLT